MQRATWLTKLQTLLIAEQGLYLLRRAGSSIMRSDHHLRAAFDVCVKGSGDILWIRQRLSFIGILNLWYSNAKALGLLRTLHRPTLVDKAAAKGQER